MLQFSVDAARCNFCGQCVSDCPASIIEQEGLALPFIRPGREADCLQCQHCLAICPPGAISILGRNPDQSLPLAAESLPNLDQMTRLVRGRRSFRHYEDANVDPALVRRLLDALANAPTGVNRRKLTFTVIDDKAVMQRFREKAMAGLVAAAQAGRIPPQLAYLQNLIPLYVEQGIDVVFRGAPHALIVSSPPDAPCPPQDIALALAYFELMAQSDGLGTVWCGLMKMTLEAVPELKPVLGLPADHVYYCMLFGPPAMRYARTVQRDDAAKIHRVTL
jgi:nitroreductase/Pyruvate/2-oxoacid:ferredoxin oxidoreductase delta subunit